MNARSVSATISRLVLLAVTVSALLATSIPARTEPASGAAPATPQTAPPPVTVTPDAPLWQAKTQAQVVGWTYGPDAVFSGVIVFNGGATTLTEVQIGCFLQGLPPGLANPVDLGFVPFGTGPV
jgi:hypothetical protein